jgi:hypothetical protein
MKLYVPLIDGGTLTFEGNYDELISIAERFLEKHGNLIAANATSEASLAESGKQPGNRRWNEHSARRLWNLLYGDQSKAVRFLVEQGGKAEYKELGKHMGYHAQRLSGILSAVTRNAQTATGDRMSRLVDWRIADRGRREYYIDPEALPFFQHLVLQPS